LLAFAGAVRSSSFLLLLPIRERSEQVGQGEYVAASSIRKRPKKWRFYGKRWGTRFVEEHREISAVDSLLRSSQRWPRSSGRSISPVNLLSFLSAENPLPPPPLSLSLSLCSPRPPVRCGFIHARGIPSVYEFLKIARASRTANRLVVRLSVA
jgi:hypothetical protein